MTTPSSRPPRASTAGPMQPRAGGQSADVERALALRDVMDHAVRVQREISEAKPVRSSGAGKALAVVVCLALLGVSAWSLAVRPEFIWGARPEVPAPQADASLRFGMFLLAQRIEAFRRETGRLPGALGDIGESPAGVEYRVVSDGVFELRGVSGDQTAVFRSDQPTDSFLGNSVRVIQRISP